MNKTDQNEDYYSILGAAENATQREIELQYRRSAVRHHPDLGGDEEHMKTLNEAYRVLKDKTQRKTYDREREKANLDTVSSADTDAPISTSPALQVDAMTHQALTSSVFIVVGLVLLFIVRFQYVIFLWPLALLAVFMIFVGIVQAHHVVDSVRRHIKLARPIRFTVIVQELLFWSVVIGGGYGVYLLLAAD